MGSVQETEKIDLMYIFCLAYCTIILVAGTADTVLLAIPVYSANDITFAK